MNMRTAIYKSGERPQKEPALPTPGFQTSSLQNCQKNNFCCSNHPACDQTVVLCFSSKLIHPYCYVLKSSLPLLTQPWDLLLPLSLHFSIHFSKFFKLQSISLRAIVKHFSSSFHFQQITLSCHLQLVSISSQILTSILLSRSQRCVTLLNTISKFFFICLFSYLIVVPEIYKINA